MVLYTRRLVFFVFFVSYNAIVAEACFVSVNKILEANVIFSGELYDILAKDEGNLIYSPISIHGILSLMYQKAPKDIVPNLKEVLHVADSKTVAKGYDDLIRYAKSLDNIKLQIASRVFLNKSYKVTNNFRWLAKNFFVTDVQKVDFAQSNATRKRINNWLKKNTKSHITKLISPTDLDNSTRMVLVNAIYFLGDWLQPFNPRNTKTETFYLSGNDTVNCPMMHLNETFKYGDDADLNAQILSVPYKNTNLDFTIILPKSKDEIREVETTLQTKGITTILHSLSDTTIILSLPRFTIEKKINLRHPLTELGLGDLFSTSEADFESILNSKRRTGINKIIQKTVVKVDELGSQAFDAAASRGLLDFLKSKPVVFKADHPFIFMITCNVGEVLPVFVGRLTKP